MMHTAYGNGFGHNPYYSTFYSTSRKKYPNFSQDCYKDMGNKQRNIDHIRLNKDTKDYNEEESNINLCSVSQKNIFRGNEREDNFKSHKRKNLIAMGAKLKVHQNNPWNLSKSENIKVAPVKVSVNNNLFPNISKVFYGNIGAKRPKEKWQKGQSQLILERWQKNQKIKNGFYKSNYGTGFNPNLTKYNKSLKEEECSTWRTSSRNTSHRIYVDASKYSKNEEEDLFSQEEAKKIKRLFLFNKQFQKIKTNFEAIETKKIFNKRLLYQRLNSEFFKNQSLDDAELIGNKYTPSDSEDDIIVEDIKDEKKKKEDSPLRKVKRKASHKHMMTYFRLKLNRNFSFTKVYNKINKKQEKKRQSSAYCDKETKDYKYKTQQEFFSPKNGFDNTSKEKFNASKEENQNKKEESKKPSQTNMDSLFNKILNNNKHAAQQKSKIFFSYLGKDLMDNHFKRTGTAFFNQRQAGESSNQFHDQAQPKTLNSMDIVINSPINWKQHEEIWKNIQSIFKVPSDNEKYLIPPNTEEVLSSMYITLHPSILNFCKFSNFRENTKDSYLSFNINDNMKNPTAEIRKWKDAYKKVILRWHPDKLNPILKEIKLKDENIKVLIKKRIPLIINNMNTLFKKIMEILRKIAANKRTG
ncbi:MAG: hypothetical protein MJ252_14400 [archaeon]|nr:hypothetical protein [archaeon]